MSQFRKDPFGAAWVMISPERGLEPSDFGSVTRPVRSAASGEHDCILCPGHEQQTGSELRALRPSRSATDSPGWRARVIGHPAALLQAKAFTEHGTTPFVYAPSSGYQELIVEHPDHAMRLETMPRDHLGEVLRLYRDRLEHLASRPHVRHVQITRNVGRAAGAMFSHPHAQVLALPVDNRWVEEERQAAATYFARQRRCLFCEVITTELERRERVVSANATFVALTPYASRQPFETWIVPRQHSSGFGDLSSNNLADLAELLQSVIVAMNTALDHPPYNIVLHTLPSAREASYHWHFEILPRLTNQTGFDWGSGFYINPTPPEDAARFLRESLALRGASL
ncbi:MAG: galactose-1-phosphate uridylyltransferase [Trueperaceae bacterium]|nr:galactose-1-phosphate uridylyltransferase [Trueperaceae bacterium]